MILDIIQIVADSTLTIAAIVGFVKLNGLRKSLDVLDNNHGVLRETQRRLQGLAEHWADRQLNPASDPNDGKPMQVREIIRSEAKAHDLPVWREIVRAAERGYRLDIGAKGRETTILAVDERLRKLDRVAVASRLHHDEPTEETALELETALKDAGFALSRSLEVAPS